MLLKSSIHFSPQKLCIFPLLSPARGGVPHRAAFAELGFGESVSLQLLLLLHLCKSSIFMCFIGRASEGLWKSGAGSSAGKAFPAWGQGAAGCVFATRGGYEPARAWEEWVLRVLRLRAGCPDRSWLEWASPSGCTEQLCCVLQPAWATLA